MDDNLWTPVVSGCYGQNLDFSGFSAVVAASYESMRAVAVCIARQLPFCVFQHFCVSRLNAHLIRYVQIENNENHYADEESPYDVFSDESFLIPALIYEYFQSIGKTMTIEGDVVRVNIPFEALPKDAIPAIDNRDACEPGSFGVITSQNHNLYECYASPLITKKLIQECQINPASKGDWLPLPRGFFPEGSTFTENCIGYRMREKIAPDFQDQLNQIRFCNSNDMEGRLCYSPSVERIVQTVLDSFKDKLSMKSGFPPFTTNSAITSFITYEDSLGDEFRLSDLIGSLNSHTEKASPECVRAALCGLKRQRSRDAPGLCIIPPAAQRDEFVNTRNNNFDVVGPFTMSSPLIRDIPLIRERRWKVDPPTSSRYDQLLLWAKKHFTVKM